MILLWNYTNENLQKMKKIKYTKKRLESHLIMGAFYVIIGLVFISISYIVANKLIVPVLLTLGYAQVLAGVFSFVAYLFEKQRKYLTLKDGKLIKNTLIPRKIELTEAKFIKEIKGELRLLTRKSEFTINTYLIEPDCLEELKKEIKSYDVSPPYYSFSVANKIYFEK